MYFMKKVAIIFTVSFLLALGLFLAVNFYLSANEQRGALQVTSSPESKVYLDNQYLGQTPLCKCEAADMLEGGEYTIRLVPLDENLREFQEKITISQGVLTVVDRKFGENSLSEGSIISLSALEDRDATELLVVSFPQGAEVFLDDASIGNTPLLHDDPTESDHVLRVVKDGYNEKEVRIRTPLGYKLTVAVYLSTSNTNLANPVDDDAQETDILEENLTPTPDEEPQVFILDTPTDFLRVRQSPSTTSFEIGRVSPGEAFPLEDEQEGWYQITMEDGATGWISEDFAELQ